MTDKVMIGGIEYVPKVEVPKLTDERLKEALKTLTSMRYFGEDHKMKPHAWEVIQSLAPEVNKLSTEDAYDKFHEEE